MLLPREEEGIRPSCIVQYHQSRLNLREGWARAARDYTTTTQHTTSDGWEDDDDDAAPVEASHSPLSNCKIVGGGGLRRDFAAQAV